MDFNTLIERARNILLRPKLEWPVIATETTSVADLYKHYIVILAAISPVATFIGLSVFGLNRPFVGTFHIGIGALLAELILSYIVGLIMVYVMGLIIDMLAPTFGAQKNPIQALKVAAYSYTAAWVAGIFHLIPGLGVLALIGALYSIYLLYLGLPVLMKCPPDRAAGYTAVSILIAIVLAIILAAIVGGLSGTRAWMPAAQVRPVSSTPQLAPDSALGKLAALGAKLDANSKQMQAAQQSGDANAQIAAAGAAMGTLLGGGDKVEALAPEALKPFLPDTLAGLARSSLSVERNAPLGIQVAEGRATYRDAKGTQQIELEITDMGGAKGLMALAGFVGEKEKVTDHGYDKTYRTDGGLVHEKWDSRDQSGEYSLILADRFAVKLSGSHLDNIDQLKHAAAALNLSGLAALKEQGVKSG